MITSNLDVSNLSASKASLNKKADLSSKESQADGFGKELASFQAEAAPANVKSPNQFSEENEKTLTENLNNFSALQTSQLNLGENVSEELSEESIDQNPMMDSEAAKMALQGMVATQAAPVTSKLSEAQVQSPSGGTAQQNAVALNTQQALTGPGASTIPVGLNAPTTVGLNAQQNTTGLNSQLTKGNTLNSETSLLDKASMAGAKAELINQKIEGETGKFSLEGFQPVVPQAVSPELAASLLTKDNQNIESVIADIPASEQLATQEISKQSIATTPSSSEVISFLQNLVPQAETAAPVAVENTTSMAMPAMFATSQQNGAKNDSEDSNEFSSKDQERSVEIGNEQTFGHIAEKHKLNEAQVKTAEAAVALPTEAQHKNNMDQIVTHARTFLKDGGGEMVMKLTPEGLGTVDLKVAVKDGQVSIEINTQNEHVKKMFEEGAKDLRGALEVQNLNVASVKVNMAEQAQRNMNMGQFNMSDKDFARNFMGQFRDERQGFRSQSLNGVMDKFHSPAKEAGGLRPAGLAMGNSNRLNVVA